MNFSSWEATDITILDGNVGDDTLSGGGQNDLITGEGGDDDIYGGAGNDSLDGGSGADSIIGNAGNDTIDGGTGDDTIDAGAGDDLILGGSGNDDITSSGNDTIDAGIGDDLIHVSADTESLDGGAGTDTLRSSDSMDLTGLDLTNIEVLDMYTAGKIASWSVAQLSGSTYTMVGNGSVGIMQLDTDPTTIDLSGLDVSGHLGAFNVTLYSDGRGINMGDNMKGQYIYGGAGIDTLTYSDGDTLTISELSNVTGVENIVFEDADTKVYPSGDLDALNDTVFMDATNVSAGRYFYVNASSATNTKFNFTGGDADEIFFAADEDDTLDGGAGDDNLVGKLGNDYLIGGAGNDEMRGGDGADCLKGGAGGDTVWGDDGDDTLLFNTGDVVSGESILGGNLGADAGTDSIVVLSSTDFSAGTIDGIENVQLANNTTATFNETHNFEAWAVTGGSGSETFQLNIDGSGGSLDVSSMTFSSVENVILQGSSATDTYTVTSDVTEISGNGGSDEVITSEDVNFSSMTISGISAFEFQSGSSTATFDLAQASEATSTITGSGGMTINGTSGDDSLDLSGLNVSGYGGTLSVNLSGGNDTLDLGTNLPSDLIVDGGSGNDVLKYTGTAAQSTELNNVNFVETVIFGNAATNILFSADGADSGTTMALDASALTSANTFTFDAATNSANKYFNITGGGGDDIIETSFNADTISGGDGADDIMTGDGDDELYGNAGEDILDGEGGDDTLDGGTGDDEMYGGTGDDSLIAGLGADDMDGGGDFDTADYSSSTEFVNIDLGGGTALSGYAAGDTLSGIEGLIGTDFDDSLQGDAFANSIEAGVGDDYIKGGEGDDTLTGGTGTDSFAYGNITMITTKSNQDVVTDFTSGTDNIYLDGDFENMDFLWYDWTEGGEYDGDITGGLSSDAAIIWDDTNKKLWYDADVTDNQAAQGLVATFQTGSVTLADISFAGTGSINDPNTPQDWTGTAGPDTKTTALGADTLDGLAGDDVLSGSGGNDSFIGGLGDDTLDGGSGTDTLDYSAFTDSINVLMGDGEVSYTISSTGYWDQIQNFEYILGGAGDDSLWSAGGATLDGGDGNDYLKNANGSTDTLLGSDGNDTIVYGYDPSGGMADGGAGSDALRIDADIDLTSLSALDNFETLSFFYGDSVTLSGEQIDGESWNVAIDSGNTKSLTVELGSGDSVDMSNLTFDDNWISEGAEVNILGDDGDETVIGTEMDDNISGDAGADSITGGDGNDSISGGDDNDTISMGFGDDTVDGGAGDDYIYGNGNNYSDGNDSISGGLGNDTIIAQNGDDYIDGGDGDDSLVGEGSSGIGGDDTILGGAGNDTIYGDWGNSTFGDDSIEGGAGNDVINAGPGMDTVHGGDGDDSITSNSWPTGDSADILYGDAGNDSIEGYNGNDTINGGLGDDLLTGGNDSDVFVYSTLAEILSATNGDTITDFTTGADNFYFDGVSEFEGEDFLWFEEDNYDGVIENDGTSDFMSLIWDSANSKLWLDLDTMLLDGRDEGVVANLSSGSVDMSDIVILNGSITLGQGEDLTGTPGDDTLAGTTAADTISGLAGNDVIDGNNGDDTIYGGDDNDLITGGNGADSIEGATGWDTIFGNSGDDELLGGEGTDSIDGGAGDDSLYGGTEGDSLMGGAGDDLIDGGANDSVGRELDVASYATATNGIYAVLNGSSNGTVSGWNSVGQSTLTGSDGLDTLTDIEGIQGSVFNDKFVGDNTWANIFVDGGGSDDIDGGSVQDEDAEIGFDIVSYQNATQGINVSMFMDTLNNNNITGSVSTGSDTDTLTNIDMVIGSNFNDTMNGGDGEQDFTPGLGDDTVDGGTGEVIGVDNGDDWDTVSYWNIGDGTVGMTFDYFEGGTYWNAYYYGTGAFDDVLHNIEEIEGTAGDDSFYGGTADDNFSGWEGADRYEGGGGGTDAVGYWDDPDAVYVDLSAGGGIDGWGDVETYINISDISGSDHDDTIIGTDNDNRLDGSEGDDTLSGLRGEDHILGGLGDDTIRGGEGDDILSGDDGADVFAYIFSNIFSNTTNGDSIDDFTTGTDSFQIEGLGTDILWYEVDNFGGNNITGGDNSVAALIWDSTNKQLWYDGDVLEDDHNDVGVIATLSSGLVAKTDIVNDGGIVISAGNPGETWIGDGSSETHNGTADDDTLNGLGGNDTINGLAGMDIILGGDGTDSLSGGDGDDVLMAYGGAGTLSGSLSEFIDGGTGDDTLTDTTDIDFSDMTINNIEVIEVPEDKSFTFDLSQLDGQSYDVSFGDYTGLTANGTETDDDIDLTSMSSDGAMDHSWQTNLLGGDDRYYGLDGVGQDINGDEGNDTIIGGDSNDFIYGGIGDDSLIGMDSDDEIEGGAGNDWIVGGDGWDYLTGDTGNDSFVYADSNNTSQPDVIMDFTSGEDMILFMGDYEQASITWYEQTMYDGNESLSGGTDSIFVWDSNDEKLFYDMDPETTGGEAYMMFDSGNPSFGDVFLYNSTIYEASSTDYVRTGDDSDNAMNGNTYEATLYGYHGDDTITGGSGDEHLMGGDGWDVLQGVDGDDTLTGGKGSDVFLYQYGSAINLASSGDVITDFQSGYDMIMLTGDLADTPLEMYSENDFDGIIESLGSDTPVLVWDETNQQLWYDDHPTDSLSNWQGKIDMDGNSIGTGDVFAEGQTITIQIQDAGDSVITGTSGNDVGGSAMVGTGNDDTLFGYDGNDSITGGTGNELLIGGEGNDTITGGDGDDTVSYQYDPTGANINLATGTVIDGWGDTDQVTQNTVENAIGTAFDDTLFGNANANYLIGGEGEDWLDGSAGADTFYYASTADGGDRLTNFAHGTDMLHFEFGPFMAAYDGGGTLAASAFTTIINAGLASDYENDGIIGANGDAKFIYINETGGDHKLYYDANGNTAGGHTLIADFDTTDDISLDETDIFLDGAPIE
ncbi:hypothetical protein OAN24_04420 [Pseudodesulfovibrio sp.]|nr:hypothetical protein [Pseudodesulfovibrio sp.]